MKILYFNITLRCNQRCWFCAANLDRHSQISTRTIMSILRKWKIGRGDRIIINGGEPTLHDGLCGMLEEIKRRGARSNLFTNGIKLADPRYAAKLARCGLDYICIPLYGKTSGQHDAMTGRGGSFEKACAAIRNLCDLKDKGYELIVEVKLLQCKATYRINPAVARWIAGHFPKVDYISLNPALYTGEAKANIAEFAVDMLKTKALLNKAASAVAMGRVRCLVSHIPYCVLERKNRSDCTRNGFLPDPLRQPIVYFDPRMTTGIIVKKEANIDPQCKKCAFKLRCPGFKPYNLGETASEVPARVSARR
ncbi:MAG: radical SAM protein [Pseudomonadota bacterium]